MEAAGSGHGPHKAQGVPVRPGELLPSVLRTSADLAPGFSIPQSTATGATTAAAAGAVEPARRAAGPLKVAPGELLGTLTLPRVDAGAHHQALPARPALTTSPNRNRHAAGASPERSRPTATGTVTAAPAVKPAAAAGRSPGTRSSSNWAVSDVPAVGSVAMTTLPNTAAWLSSSLDQRQQAASPAAPSQQQQQQQQQATSCCTCSAAAAGGRRSPSGDDLRLLRPVDPTNPKYYWKPMPAADGKVKASAGMALDSMLGAQLLLDAGSGEELQGPVSHTLQRKSILLRVPLGAELFRSAVPAIIQDRLGHACLLVLPSDKPSNRREATAVEELLALLLQDPSTAVTKACQWRAATLGALCAESLGVVAEAVKQQGSESCWQFRQLTRNLTGKMLGSHMAKAVGSLVTSSHSNPAAAQLAQLLNSKDAVAHIGTAAAEATLQAAAAVAPTAVKPLKLSGSMLAVEAAAPLSGSSEQVPVQRQQSQQHLSRASTSKASRLQSPKGNRSSRNGSLSPTVRPQQQRVPQPEQQQHGQQCLPDAASPRSSSGSGLGQADAAGAAGNPRQSRGSLGGYAALTVDTGAERPSSSSAAGVSSTTGVAASSPGPLKSSRSDGRASSVPSQLQEPQPSPQQQRDAQQQQDAQQQSPALHRNASPERSRLQSSSSRCNSPIPALAPDTPQGYTAAGSPKPTTSARSRDGSPSHSGADDRRNRQDSMSGRAAPAAEAVRASTPEALLHTNSRLSSSSGLNCSSNRPHSQQQQQQQSPQQPPDEEGQQLEGYKSDDEVVCHESCKTGSDNGGELANVYGLSLSAAICVADLVRQVEVACVERGHALAYAWNCSMSAAEAVLVQLRAQNQQLLGINNHLQGTC